MNVLLATVHQAFGRHSAGAESLMRDLLWQLKNVGVAQTH